VSGDADVAREAEVARLFERAHRAIGSERLFEIGSGVHGMDLHQIRMVSLQPVERRFELIENAVLAAAVDFCREKNFAAPRADHFADVRLTATAGEVSR
jgi:hypothetical protein